MLYLYVSINKEPVVFSAAPEGMLGYWTRVTTALTLPLTLPL